MRQAAQPNMFAAFACGASTSAAASAAAAQRQAAPAMRATGATAASSVPRSPAGLAATPQSAHQAGASSSTVSSTVPAAATGSPLLRSVSIPSASSPACSSTPGWGSKRRRISAEEPKGVVEKLGQQPLRLIIVGHNPSEHAWQTGHYYSNPSNRMWPILIKTGIAPPGTKGAEADDAMPTSVGVGFTDVGTGHPGTDSKDFSSATFEAWGHDFYARLAQHMQAASASIGCVCGRCGAPALVAFSGKRQYLELLNRCRPKRTPKVSTVPLGPQVLLPKGWPLPAAATEVWVCSSTSGASALTNEAREGPYVALAARMAQIPWPRSVVPACGIQAAATAAAAAAAAVAVPAPAATPAVMSSTADVKPEW